MKYITILTTATALILFTSCGNNQKETASIDDLISQGNIETIRAKRVELKTQQAAINSDLDKVDAAIKQLGAGGKTVLVTTQEVNPQPFMHFIEVQGNVDTKQNIILFPEFQGTLQRVLVTEGQRVRKGDLLAVINDGGLASQLSQLEAQAALAETTFERQSRLWKQNIGSEIQYLQAKTNNEAAKSAVKQLKSQLEKTQITAPFSGVIDDVFTELGTVVSPGQPLMRLVNLNQMYVKADVPERYLKSITPKTSVNMFFPVLDQEITGKIRQTGSYINPGNRTFSIEIPIQSNSQNIKPNLTARVKINDYTNPSAILVPLSVISENAEGQQYVYIAINETGTTRAQQKIITTGKSQGDYIEVLSGLEASTQLILEGARTVNHGQEITILKN